MTERELLNQAAELSLRYATADRFDYATIEQEFEAIQSQLEQVRGESYLETIAESGIRLELPLSESDYKSLATIGNEQKLTIGEVVQAAIGLYVAAMQRTGDRD